MTSIPNDSTHCATGYLGYVVPKKTQLPSEDELRKKLIMKATPEPATIMRTGYNVPVDTTKAELPKFDNQDEDAKLASQPVTTNYPNGQWQKINGEWKKVVSKTLIPATTSKEKQDLMDKWLNDVK